jgi:diphthamide synthase (EF-2-diphthine--ammonia ligase)
MLLSSRRISCLSLLGRTLSLLRFVFIFRTDRGHGQQIAVLFRIVESTMKRILLSWSSGKDSAWSLHVLRQQREYEIAGLLTTFNAVADRVAMHAVRRELVERQASGTGLPLWNIPLPWPCSNEQYELLMAETCAKAVAAGIEGIAFGDLFLEDVRSYREKQMRDTGLQPVFPLWGQPTRDLAKRMIASGMRAKLTCVDTEKLDARFCRT